MPLTPTRKVIKSRCVSELVTGSIFASLTQRPQRSVSVLSSAAIDSGEPGKAIERRAREELLRVVAAVIWLNQPASLSMIGRGVPAGTTTPNQGAMSNSPSPSSLSVGTSGSARERFAEVAARMRMARTARLRHRAGRVVGDEIDLAAQHRGERADRGLEGTVGGLQPARSLKSSAATWPVFEPVP
jgi:hypothetical protein